MSTSSNPAASNAGDAKPALADIRVLIVDNDEAHARTVAESLERVGYQCRVATGGKDGVKKIDQETFDIIITDLMMNDIGGMDVLNHAKEALPDAEVIPCNRPRFDPSAVEAMQRGAFNYLQKPLDLKQLRIITQKASEALVLKRTNLELRQRLDEKFGFEGVIGNSTQMNAVIDRLKRIAPTDASVLIQGETGTGKELIAQAIHQNSPRKGKPFVALNCARAERKHFRERAFWSCKRCIHRCQL